MGCKLGNSPRTSAIGVLIVEYSATMKQLIENHKKEITEYTDLDVKAIENVTYLHEFDRQIQYDSLPMILNFNTKTSQGVQPGDTLLRMRTTVMRHLRMLSLLSGYHFSHIMLLTILYVPEVLLNVKLPAD